MAKVYVLVITPGVPADGPPINCKFQGSKCLNFCMSKILIQAEEKLCREREREQFQVPYFGNDYFVSCAKMMKKALATQKLDFLHS